MWGRPPTRTAGEFARGEAVTVGADDEAAEILRTMAEYEVRRLPVIDGPTPVGVVARADAARALPDPQGGELLGALSGRRPRQACGPAAGRWNTHA
ncbi:CBS domain-containing protein [Streptomyces sp. NRRL B-24572]|uniref:CBS domain-containing protein n=1 Tax=Streptomyces sp. NRRL B-24572 TaxID=1962156 RepID=UPI00277D0746|nr:CBS domain-containing protein [Streptomyces sp. NRRL B-24572]